ncbi:MAG: carbohydrate-binding protein [Bacteroidales bacterium]|nr:carbohydrate-binding protein [Bacteroidales bacterium]
MKSNRLFLFIWLLLLFCLGISAQNPTVENNVATYHSDINIGRKFQAPDTWDKIIIKENVTVTGSFYFPTRTRAIEIAGESRETSIIKGDGTRPTDDGIVGRSYSAIRFDKSPDVYIHDLRSLDPMKFHIGGGFGNVIVERCDLIESRGEHSSDGIHGGSQSVTVRDCFIDTWDDALYTRECTLVENTTIVHNKNGSPFMTSWGASVEDNYQCIVRNCTVIDNSNKGYNHGVFAWAGKHADSEQTIKVKFEGTFTRNTADGMNASPMYTIGRLGGDVIKNATILVDGICPSPNSIELRSGASNCQVGFINCSDGSDSIPPSAPGIPTINQSTTTSIDFSWNAASDDQGVMGYELYVNDEFHSLVFNTTTIANNLMCETGYELKVRAYDGAMNYSEFSDSIVATTATCPSINSRIEAESFISQQGIQSENTQDVGGGLNIGFIHDGDWSAYKVNVPESKDYKINFRVACESNPGTIELLVDNVSKGSVEVPVTGAFQNWQTVSETFSLEKGTHEIKLLYKGGGGFLFNVNWFQSASGSSISNQTNSNVLPKVYPNPFHNKVVIETNASNVQLFNIVGTLIHTEVTTTTNGYNLNTENLNNGIYLLRINNATYKLLKK